jgi:galactose mutarotase-like enzyme
LTNDGVAVADQEVRLERWNLSSKAKPMTGEIQPASIVIRSERLVAEISPHGAELIRLQDRDGKDLLWNGCAKWWTGRAPLLFPIVGGLPNDAVMIDGETFSMRQHGFARNKQFSVIGASASGCSFRLASDDETRRQFPFDFVLEAAFVIEGAALRIGATIFNKSSRAMPISFGFHPAFRWPLPYGGSRQDHEIRFEKPESAPIRRLTDGLLDMTATTEVFEGSIMSLDDAMFVPGALIFDQLKSRAVNFGVSGEPSIRIRFPDLPHLGVWTKPGAGFLCIEPWQGYAAPLGFAGELKDKPGGLLLAANASTEFTIEICLLGANEPSA